jgi:hypothetical protein
MTVRTRHAVVVSGLVILVLWALATWMASTAEVPAPSLGPSPTGSIGSGPATFVPSDDVSPPP